MLNANGYTWLVQFGLLLSMPNFWEWITRSFSNWMIWNLPFLNVFVAGYTFFIAEVNPRGFLFETLLVLGFLNLVLSFRGFERWANPNKYLIKKPDWNNW